MVKAKPFFIDSINHINSIFSFFLTKLLQKKKFKNIIYAINKCFFAFLSIAKKEKNIINNIILIIYKNNI